MCIAESLNTNEPAAYPARGGWLARPGSSMHTLVCQFVTALAGFNLPAVGGLGPGNEGCGRVLHIITT